MPRLLFVLVLLVTSSILLASCVPPAKSSLLIELQRSGGLAGVDERLQVYRDGKAVVETKAGRKELQLTDAQLAEISATSEQANIIKMKKEYLPDNNCCDLFTFDLTYYSSNGQKHTVRATSNSIPKELMPVLEQLAPLLQ